MKAVDGSTLTLEELSSTNTVELKKDVVKKHFMHSYCRTCHSFQGSSIEGKITIFDWKFFFVNRKWIYTAVTRATELKNVLFFSGPSGDFDEQTLDRYLARKVESHRKQDVSGKSLPISYNTFVSQLQTIANQNAPLANVSRSLTRLKSVFVTFQTAWRLQMNF